MGRHIRQLASDTAVYGLSTMAARFMNYLLVPFYTNVFATAEYGVVGKIYAAFVFLNVLYTYGMESAYLKYAAKGDDAGRKRVFSTAFWTLLASSALLSASLALFHGSFSDLLGLGPEHETLVFYMAAILAVDALLALPMADLRLSRKPWAFAAIRMTGVVVNLGLNFWLILGRGWGVEAVLAGNLAASVVSLAMAGPVLLARLGAVFGKPDLAGMLRFGLPYVPTGAAYAVTEAIDRFFLDRMDPAAAVELYGAGTTPEDVVGVYNACYKLGVFMLLFVQMFRFAWQPFFLQLQDDAEAPAIFARVFTLFTALGAFVFLAVSLFAARIVAIPVPGTDGTRHLIGEAYWAGVYFVPLILLAYLAQGWYTHFTAGIFIRGKTAHLPWITLVGAGVTLAINGLFTAQHGMSAAATATFMSHFAMAIVMGWVAHRFFPIPYEWRKLWAVALITAAAYAAHAWVLPEEAAVARGAILLGAGAGFTAVGALPRPWRKASGETAAR